MRRAHDALVEEHAAGDAGDLQRRWLVTVRRDLEGWRVLNREELADQ